MKEIKEMKEMKEYGITLIALVVTIIILLILAGVTIGMATNGTGLFDKAKEAAQKYKNVQEDEEMQIAKYTNEIDSYIGGTRNISNYSLTEQNIGTWVNEETLYQKTFIVDGTNAVDGYVVDTLSDGVYDKICYIYGIVIDKPSGEISFTLPNVYGSYKTRFKKDNNKLKIVTNDNWSNYELVFTVQYTKTTQTN